MKECRTCKRFDRVSNRIGVCTDTGEVVGINSSCSNHDERQKISEKKLLAIAIEAVRLHFDYNYSVEDAIAMAKKINEDNEKKGKD